jgi:uncharacterized protein DUF6544
MARSSQHREREEEERDAFMNRAVTVGAIAVGGIAAAAVAAVGIASALWDRATARARQELASAASPAADASAATATMIAQGVPAPVARYLRFALVPDQPLIARATVRWAGEFRTAPNARWSPFAADQEFTTDPPGFVWDATIRMMPLLSVRVRDQYVRGRGATIGKLGGLIPVANSGGTPAVAASALARYLGEAAWFPTALLPSARLHWTPLDDSTARATLTDGPTRVSGDFHFAASGEIRRVTMMRYRDVNGRGVVTSFEGRYIGEYRRLNGVLVPSAGEVAWLLPEGPFSYWRARIVDAVFH